jgi:hypothetical protein
MVGHFYAYGAKNFRPFTSLEKMLRFELGGKGRALNDEEGSPVLIYKL